jgi:2-C-methyl-D-erythritol 2,4-cyclodiphosphate synthase
VHFPPDDPAYEGASSMELLSRVVRMLAAAGWQARQVSAVVVAERPRLAPHVPAMRAGLAERLGIAADAVGIQVTTNEGLGAIGRGEGIAAWATALLGRM